MIPRLLHYVYVTPSPVEALSTAYHFWASSCARVNVGFQLVLWTAPDCDRLATTLSAEVGSWYSTNLSRLGTIRQADFCRLMVLHRFGGIYLDLDVLCVRSLAPLLRLPLFAADEPVEHKKRWGRRPGTLFPCNAVLGSQPHHPFWESEMATFRERCNSWERRHGHRHRQRGGTPTAAPIMTGPHMMAPVWREYRKRGRQPELVLLPTETFYPVRAAVERGRAFDAPRSYPNATLAAHQWGSFYTRGTLHDLGRQPVPAFLQRPFDKGGLVDGFKGTAVCSTAVRQPTIFFFSHIPRTSGSVLSLYLHRAAANDSVWGGSLAMQTIRCIGGKRDVPGVLGWAARTFQSRASGLVYGHAQPSFLSAQCGVEPRGVAVLTLLREPLAHLMSQSNVGLVCAWLQRALDDTPAECARSKPRRVYGLAHRDGRPVSARALAETAVRNSNPDWIQSRWVGECGPASRGANASQRYTRACAARARDGLAQLRWFGITEELAASLCLLHATTDLPPPPLHADTPPVRLRDRSGIARVLPRRPPLDPAAPRRSASAKLARHVKLRAPALYAALASALASEISFYDDARRLLQERLRRSGALACSRYEMCRLAASTNRSTDRSTNRSALSEYESEYFKA